MLQKGWEMWLFHSTQHCWDASGALPPHTGLPSARTTWEHRNKPNKGPQRPSRALSCEERVRKQGMLSQEKRRLSEDPSIFWNTWWMWGKEDGFFLVAPSDRTRGNRHKQKYMKYHFNSRKIFVLWGWMSTVTGFPEWLWSPHLWRGLHKLCNLTLNRGVGQVPSPLAPSSLKFLLSYVPYELMEQNRGEVWCTKSWLRVKHPPIWTPTPSSLTVVLFPPPSSLQHFGKNGTF